MSRKAKVSTDTDTYITLKESQGYLEVTLDGRPLKTPDGNKLRLPPQKKVLAALIANEWDIQDKALKPHTLPLVSDVSYDTRRYLKCLQTSIAARAIDGLGSVETRTAVANTLLRYFDTDAIWYVFVAFLLPFTERFAVIMRKNQGSYDGYRKNIGNH